MLKEFHSVTLMHLDWFGFNNKSSELMLSLVSHDTNVIKTFNSKLHYLTAAVWQQLTPLIYKQRFPPKLPFINVNSYNQTLCNLLLSHLYAHLLGSYVPNMWKQKYCAKIQAKNKLTSWNLEESAHNCKLIKPLLTLHFNMHYTKRN